MWIYFFKKKSEVFDRFKQFKALVENQTEKKIKVLRTYNGGEFCSKEFEEFYKKSGITWQKTTPYTPQQNEVAERMNKTLMERGYKLWNPVTRKVVYNRDVVFKEVKDGIKHKVQPKEPEKIEFELKEEESDSIAEEELEDEEPQTSGVRILVRERRKPERYSPFAFYSNFSLFITDNDPITVKEVVDSEDGKL
eukprot:PITA_27719